jgi:hypothetical protein
MVSIVKMSSKIQLSSYTQAFALSLQQYKCKKKPLYFLPYHLLNEEFDINEGD